MSEERLHEVLARLRAGDRAGARQQLAALLKENPQNEKAWLAMADAVDEPTRRRQCLETVLKINPQNAVAREELAHMERVAQRDRAAFEAPGAKQEALSQERHPATSEGITVDTTAAEAAGAAATGATAEPTAKRNRHPLLLAGGAVLLVLCLCTFVPFLLFQWTDSSSTDADPAEAQEQPLREIPATNTPRSSGASDSRDSGSCALAAERYLERITESVYTFSELVKLRSEVSTDVEMAEVAIALEGPYNDFQDIAPPDCAARDARRIEQGMERVILGLGEYAAGMIDEDEAQAEVDAGLSQMLNALEAIVALSEG